MQICPSQCAHSPNPKPTTPYDQPAEEADGAWMFVKLARYTLSYKHTVRYTKKLDWL